MTKTKVFFLAKHRKVLSMMLVGAMMLTTVSVAFAPVVAKAENGDIIGATGKVATQNWGDYTNSASTVTGSNTAFNSNWEGATEYNNKNEFFIRTAEDFNEFWYQATNGGKTYAGKTVRFANNITLTGGVNSQNYKTWTVFQGTLDGDLGNGEMAIIYGMNRRTGDATQGGLFTSSLNATIKNIVFKECDVFGWKGVSLLAQNAKDTTFENIHMWNCRVQNDDGNSYDFVGGFSAYAAGSTYRNCSYTGSNIQETAKDVSTSYVYCGGRVTKNWGSENGWYGIAGAFVGQAEKSPSGNPIIIENCYVNSNIQSRQGDVGGFVGLATTDCQGVNVRNSTMNGYAKATDYTRSNIESFGGLIGRTLVPTTITSCVNNAVVKGKKSVGGIVGYSGNSITIQNTLNNGNVLSNNEFVGGFTGLQNNTGTKLYDNCYNKGNVFSDSTGTSVGGFVGNSSNSTIQNSCNVGEIKGTNYFGGIYGSMQNGTAVNVDNCLSIGNITRASGSGTNYGGIGGEYKGGTNNNNYYANASSNIAVGGMDDASVSSQNLSKGVNIGLGRYNTPMWYVDQAFMNKLGITSIFIESLSSEDTAVVGVNGNNIRGFQTGASNLTGTLVIRAKELTTNGFSGTENTICFLPYSVTATVDSSTKGTNDWIVTSQSKGTSPSGTEYNVAFTVKTANSSDVPTDVPLVTVTGPDGFSETVTVTQNGNIFTGKIVLPIDGDYIFTYSYPGTLDSALTQTVTAGKAITTSNISVSSTPIIGSEVTITATVDDAEGVIDFEKDATIKINNALYPINSSGIVKFTPQNTDMNQVEFNFNGNDINKASSATTNFVAGKETPSMLFSSQPASDYNGSVYSDAVLDATVVHNFTADPSDVIYTYYVDSSCQTKTTFENSGAVSQGGAPAFAGDYWLQAVSPENDYYNQVAVTKSFTINKAKITATVTTSGKVYDGTDATTGTVAVVGSVDGDGVALVVNNLKFDSPDAGNRSASGTITFAVGQESNTRNYEIDQDNSTFSNSEIEKKEVMVSVTAKSKIYDGTSSAEFDSATITGLIAADANDVTATSTDLSFEDANVAANKAVIVGVSTLGGTKSANYTISSTVAANAEITPKQLVIAVNPIKIYQGQYIDGFNFDNFQSEIEVTGFVNGETIDSLGSSFKKPLLAVDSSVNGATAFQETSFDATISDTENGNYSYPSTVSFLLTCEKEYNVVAPTIVYGNGYVADTWTAGDVEVTASGSTTDSGIARYEYSTDIGVNWTEMTGTPEVANPANIESATATITTEGKTEILFRAISNSGVEGASESSIIKIDKTAPTSITASYAENSFFEFLNNATFGLFFNETATVTISALDDNGTLDVSGVKGFSVAFDDEFSKDDLTAQATDGTATFTIDPQFKGKFTVTATDNAGNEFAENGTSSFIVDAETPIAPTIAFDNSYVADTWAGNDVVVTVSGATADSGIAKYQYSTNDGATWNDMTGIPEVDANPSNIASASLTINSNGITNVIFRAVSNSGVEGAKTAPTTIKIDKTTPVADVQSAYNFGRWTNEDVEITVTNTENNESNVAFKYSTDGTTWVDMTDGKLAINADTNATYKFKAISEAGVEAVSGEFTVKVQKTVPTTVNYSINPSTPDGTNDWYKTKPTLSVEGNALSATSAPITSVSYKLYTGTTVPASFTKVDGTTATPIVSADGNYTLVYFATDEAGNNSGETTKTFSVDTTAPTAEVAVQASFFKEFISTVTFGVFLKDSAEITIKSEDKTSGVESVKYQKVAKGDSYDVDGTWTAYSSPVKVNANQEFAIYAKVTDKAGHVTIVNSNGIVVYTDSTLKTDEARFCPDENEVREGYEDVVVEMNLNGNTLDAIMLNGEPLVKGTDYTVEENSVTLLKEYLAKVVKSDVEFTFTFNPMGEVYVDGGINNAPATAQFKVVKVTHVGVPKITTKFDEKTVYNKGVKAKELKVYATTAIGELTYQWFLNGKAIQGATEASFVPATESNGIFEYYVQVTSTDKTVNGEQVSIVDSDVATIIVKNSEVTLPVLPDGAPAITLLTDVEGILNDNLTEEDRENLEKGYDIKFVAEIKAKGNVLEADKAELEQAVKGNVVDLFDISITKVVTDSNGIETSENMTSLAKLVQFSIQIPDSELAEGRTFAISRLHNSSVEELKDIDSKANVYTFETDKFSAYALSYTDAEKSETTQPGTSSTDKPETTTKPIETTKPGGEKAPATGDNSSSVPYYFAGISGVVLLAVVVEEIIKKKKAKENQDK